jgi:hypothetical protein
MNLIFEVPLANCYLPAEFADAGTEQNSGAVKDRVIR